MDPQQIKSFIAQKIPEGYNLSKIQDLLKEQGVQITFMELRLLASEIEEEVFKAEETKKEIAEQDKNRTESLPAGESPAQEEQIPSGVPFPRPPEDDDEEPGYTPPQEILDEAAPEEGNAEKPIRGKTVVELSKLARPGVLACGSVKFGSGVTAEWLIDQMQRLGLENASGQPDEQDVREFQMELQKLFS